MRPIDADALMKEMDNHFRHIGRAEEIRDMIDDLPTIKPASNWIPCADGLRLPNFREDVLIQLDGGNRRTAYRSGTDSKWWWMYTSGVAVCDAVLAWQPLSEPYKPDHIVDANKMMQGYFFEHELSPAEMAAALKCDGRCSACEKWDGGDLPCPVMIEAAEMILYLSSDNSKLRQRYEPDPDRDTEDTPEETLEKSLTRLIERLDDHFVPEIVPIATLAVYVNRQLIQLAESATTRADTAEAQLHLAVIDIEELLSMENNGIRRCWACDRKHECNKDVVSCKPKWRGPVASTKETRTEEEHGQQQ